MKITLLLLLIVLPIISLANNTCILDGVTTDVMEETLLSKKIPNITLKDCIEKSTQILDSVSFNGTSVDLVYIIFQTDKYHISGALSYHDNQVAECSVLADQEYIFKSDGVNSCIDRGLEFLKQDLFSIYVSYIESSKAYFLELTLR